MKRIEREREGRGREGWREGRMEGGREGGMEGGKESDRMMIVKRCVLLLK